MTASCHPARCPYIDRMRNILRSGMGLGLATLLAVGSGCSQQEAKPQAAATAPAEETQKVATEEVATDSAETSAEPTSGKQTEETKLEDGRKVVSSWDEAGLEMAYYDAEGNLVAKEVAVQEDGKGLVSAEVFNGKGELLFSKAFVYDSRGDLTEVVYSKGEGAVWYIFQPQDEGEHKYLDADRKPIAKERLEAEGFVLDPFNLE